MPGNGRVNDALTAEQKQYGWQRKALRRGKMLNMCATFLRSVMQANDDCVRLSGLKRGEEAEAQYHFASELAKSIDREIESDRKYDDNRNYRRANSSGGAESC